MMILSKNIILLFTAGACCVLGRGGLLHQDYHALIKEMMVDESFEDARRIAEPFEELSEDIMNRISDNGLHKKWIRIYTKSSTNINKQARSDIGCAGLDAALHAIQEVREEDFGGELPMETLYRSLSYRGDAKSPYGADIKVGDYVTDTAYISTSTTKQFVQGKTYIKKPDGIMKLVMRARMGSPIALKANNYSNSFWKEQDRKTYTYNKETALPRKWKRMAAKIATLLNVKNKGESKAFVYDKDDVEDLEEKFSFNRRYEKYGPRAGQAEVLFQRNSVWQVRYIEDELSAALEEVTQKDVSPEEWKTIQSKLKNMYTGEPMPKINNAA